MSATERPCPACGSEQHDWAFFVSGYPHVRCAACSTLYVQPLPDADAIRETYTAGDYHASAAAAADRMRSEAQARVEILGDLGCRSVLEIGCGPGHFLDAARDSGVTVEAVDPAPTARAAIDRGHRVHPVWLDAFTPEARYDAIALWEVLEHLPDPVPALTRVATWLTGPRVIALSTPSSSGLPARLLGRRFPMIAPPDHLALFTHRGLTELLARARLRPIRWTSFSGLGRGELERGYQRFVLGSSAPGAWVSRVLAAATQRPLRWIDRTGLGTSFEVYACRMD